MKIKLAEALLRRKELSEQVERLRAINVNELFVVKAKRVNVTDSVDDLTAQVPKISIQQVTHAFDDHARNLRMVDAAIQQANWTTEIDVDEKVMAPYVDPYVKD